MANNLCISKTKLVRPQTTGWKREIEQNKTMQQTMLAALCVSQHSVDSLFSGRWISDCYMRYACGLSF